MNKALFAAFLIGIEIAAAQTPPDQARQIEAQKETMRRAARSAPVKIIGYPTLRPLRADPHHPDAKENGQQMTAFYQSSAGSNLDC